MAALLDTRHMKARIATRATDLKLVDRIIEAGLFGTQPVDTMMAFTATCQGAMRQTTGNAEIERAEGGKVVVESTSSDGRGNLVYDQKAVTL